jgi:hypothetical protein
MDWLFAQKSSFTDFFLEMILGIVTYARRLGLEVPSGDIGYKEKITNLENWKSGRIRGFLHANSISYRLLKFVVMNSFTRSMGCDNFPEEVVRATTTNTWVGQEFGIQSHYWVGKNPNADCAEGSCSDPPYHKIYTADGKDYGLILGYSNYNKGQWGSCKTIRMLGDIQVDPEDIVGAKLSKKAIIEAKELSNEAGAEFIVIIIPTKEEINWYLKKPGENFISYPKEEIKKFCRDESIRCLDLTPILKEHALKGEQAYFTDDSHFNDNGHKIAAQAIYAYLNDNNLLPRSAKK